MVFLIRGIPLNNDVVLTILAQLTVRDVLAMRQVRSKLQLKVLSGLFYLYLGE